MTAETLFDVAELVHRPVDTRLSIQERFEQFHADNRWVYAALERLVSDWLSRGHQRCSTKQFFEVIRWQYGRATTSEGGFRCNNDFTSRYARLLIDEHPDWAAAIQTRALRAA